MSSFKNVMIFVLNDIDNVHWKDGSTYRPAFWLSIQIENCLSLGWKKEDIIIGTNFKFKYKGIESVILENSTCDYSPVMSKTLGIYELMNRGILTGDFWVHDLDAWQNYNFEFPDIADIGFTTSPSGLLEAPRSINSGSYFIRQSAKDLIEYAIEMGNKMKCRNDEHAWNTLNPNVHPVYKDRVKFLDQTYNIGGGNRRYPLASKPILVIHDRNLLKYKNCPMVDGEIIISDRLYNLLIENKYINAKGEQLLNRMSPEIEFEIRSMK